MNLDDLTLEGVSLYLKWKRIAEVDEVSYAYTGYVKDCIDAGHGLTDAVLSAVSALGLVDEEGNQN